jgi:hypothetical protein
MSHGVSFYRRNRSTRLMVVSISWDILICFSLLLSTFVVVTPRPSLSANGREQQNGHGSQSGPQGEDG